MMSANHFEKQVQHHLRLLAAPDYTAKGDAVNFFKINHRKALPVLERMAARPNSGLIVAQALNITRSAAGKTQQPRKKRRKGPRFNDLF
jgi:hypothetical protein